MAFFDKLGDLARNIGDKATDAIETTKLNSKINAEKTAIAENMRQIGEYYYKKHQNGEPDDASVAGLYAAIDGHNKTIADIQAEIVRIETDGKVQEQAAPVAPAATTDPTDATAAAGTSCPSCGNTNPPGTRFCGECGNKLEA